MRRVLRPLIASLVLLVLTASTVSASLVVQRTWRASLGTGGVNGRVEVTGYTNDTGIFVVTLVNLNPNATYYPSIWAGSCSAPKAKIVTFRPQVTDATGAINRTVAIGSSAMNNIWYYGRPGSISVHYAYGRQVKCANLGYYHATRVYIPSYKINLPVVPGPSGYPYCNVAMYQKILWQPTEPGATFIYAHARTGMFLPLLNASKINNGAAMIGKLVYVYTSNSMMYTYKIVQVRRHVKSVQSAVGVTTEQLWLQTSEGPNFTYPKLVVLAKPDPAHPPVLVSYAASHPTPHPVKCG